MNTKTFYGRIWLTSGGHPVEVMCSATSPSQASAIIKGIYGASFKSWARHMASN
jgi:hypothetical protein